MDKFEVKDSYTLSDVPKLTKLLRDPDEGCAWDKKQTHDSLRQDFLEEVCEAIDAIDRKDTYALCEELGDVLLQVSLHSEMESEQGTFDIDGVADMLCKKLVLRHPHIFGDIETDDPDVVLKNWEAIKRVEKAQKTGSDAIEAVPKALPALMRSQKVQKRAAYVGFDYENADGALADLASEVDELTRAVHGDGDVFEELGDVLFSAVNVARFAHVDSELALTRACDKFAQRFKETERLAALSGIDMNSADMNVLNDLWAQAKKELTRRKFKMTKAELIAKVAENVGCTKKDAETSVNAVFEAVTEALKNGEKVQIVGFGNFDVKDRAARVCTRPGTDTKVDVPATRVPKFTAGKALKEAVAK